MHTKFTLTIEDADGVSQTMARETNWPDASPHFWMQRNRRSYRYFMRCNSKAIDNG